MSEDGHRYTHGAPSTGWPTFDPDGRIVTDEPDDTDDEDAEGRDNE